jgi:murein L,D-transpeptidase YcbB/YkuD
MARSRRVTTRSAGECAVPLLRFSCIILTVLAGAFATGACRDAPTVGDDAALPVRPRMDSVDAVNAELERTLWSQQTPDYAAAPVWRVLRQVYERRRYAALWVGDTARLGAAARAVCSAAALGFDPAAYVPAPLAETAVAATPEARADLELRLSAAVVTLGRHLALGRATPDSLMPAWATDTLVRDTMLAALLTDPDPSAALGRLGPGYPEYAELAAAHKRYLAIAAAGGWPHVLEGPPVRRGTRDPRLVTLRARLAASGDLDPAGTGDLLDRRLAAALSAFQRRHGLAATGSLDTATIRALNVPARARVGQLEANLERLRWLPGRTPVPYLLADLRAGRLRVHAGGTVAHATSLGGADAAADSVAPIAEHAVSAVALRNGRIELVLEGNPPLTFFGTADSAVRRPVPPPEASLAVRMAGPVGVARFLLGDNPGWDETRIRAAARADSASRIAVARAVPLYIASPTAFVRDGAIHFRHDRGGADSALAAALAMPAGRRNGAAAICGPVPGEPSR